MVNKPVFAEESLRNDYGWAVDIVRQQFNQGLTRICDKNFLEQRYVAFKNDDDPIYAALLAGVADEALSQTFVSYWTIAQTLATQSRFWLESAIARILLYQVRREDRPRKISHICTQTMLTDGWLAGRPRRGIADLGEHAFEYVAGPRPFRVPVQRHALQTIDVMVGDQEREFVRRQEFRRSRQGGTEYQAPRDWQRYDDKEVIDRDEQSIQQVVDALKGPPSSETPIQCNLIVIEPDPNDKQEHAWVFRFINPKTFSSHAQRKQERVNLLRVYALMTQEKILRHPAAIKVCVAEIVPRATDFDIYDRHPDYFSAATYWPSDRLWAFIGVPFEAVQLGIQDAGTEFQKQLREGLRGLLPKVPDQGGETRYSG